MALTYDLSKVTGRPLFDEKGYMLPDVEKMIFMTIAAGIGEITEDNWSEFWARVTVTANLDNWGGSERISAAQVKSMIGLKCNVAYEDREEWAARILPGRVSFLAWGIENDE
jgi:hypothetical protein